jgi:RNA polymerase sigma factor (sigma-70 family)
MYTDDQLLTMLQASQGERDQALEYLFTDPTLKGIVVRKIMSKGGQDYDAEDAFQQGFKVFYRFILEGKFQGKSTLRTFFIGICIRCWLDGLKQSFYQRTTMSDDLPTLDEEYQDSPEVELMDRERKSILLKVLELLDHRCREVILMGNQGFSGREIQDKLALEDVGMVRKIRYHCMSKLREKIAEQPHLLGLLKSLNYG